jgi:hypothetical protein
VLNLRTPGRGGVPSAAAETACALELAAKLLGAPCSSATRLSGGGNSRLYRVCAADANHYALKCYPSRNQDRRDRLGREWRTLTLLTAHGIQCVPRPLARDRCAALYQWIEGSPVQAPGVRDLNNLSGFLDRTHAIGRLLPGEVVPNASDACTTPAHITAQLRRRLQQLERTQQPAALRDFLRRELRPALQRESDRFLQATGRAGKPMDRPCARLTLSPADAGFHNALRTDRGLVFLDFEYFGWDDPAKLAADILLHPRGAPPPELRPRFLEAAVERYGDDRDFLPRLRRSLPLFGLTWCLILLNEFLPEGLQRRVHAGQVQAAAADSARARQLGRARALLQRVPHLARELTYET